MVLALSSCSNAAFVTTRNIAIATRNPSPSTQPPRWFGLTAQPTDDSSGIKEEAANDPPASEAVSADADERQRAVKRSLEEKMKSWEVSSDDVKRTTLGGVVPKSWAESKLDVQEGMSNAPDAQRSDAFDLGLYIAFPLMVISGLMVAFFPLLLDNIDTTSVGPPPTI